MQLVHDLYNPATALGGLTYAVLFFAAAWFLNRSIRKGIDSVLRRDHEERIDRTAIHFVRKLTHILVYVVAFLFFAHLVPALRHFGTALLASFGLASVVIALAAQSTLGNIISGISILLYRPFKVGDILQLQTAAGAETGTLEEIGLGYSVVRTFDHRKIVVPNSLMAAQVATNLSDPQMMAIVNFDLDYSADIENVQSALTEIASAHPLVLEVVGCPVTELGSGGVVVSLRVWCHGAGDAAQVRADLYRQAKRRFDSESIGFAGAATNVLVAMQRSP
jgi:small conductance mechanosensitive channel